MDNNQLIEVRDQGCSRWGKNKLFSSIARELKCRKMTEARRKREQEIFQQRIELAELY